MTYLKYLLLHICIFSISLPADTPLKNGLLKNLCFEAKGHFYLTQHQNRTLFVTPEGHGFYPIGINHLNHIYNKGVPGKTKEDASQTLLSHMKSWGFNCAGYGTSPQLMEKQVPFIGSINFAKQGFYHLNHADFPDVFDPSFESKLEGAFKRTAKWTYHPKLLMGMVWTDLPAWNLHKSRMLRQTDWVSEVRNKTAEAPGKVIYVEFLLQKYKNNLDELKSYYQLNDDDLKVLINHDFKTLYRGHPSVIKDDEEFMAKIAEQYYRLGSMYHQKYYPNIPLFGDRFLLGDHPDAILKIASRYVDALAIQVGDGYGESQPSSYPYPKSTIDHLHQITSKPILIADHQISFASKEFPQTTFTQAGDEKNTSLETQKFLKSVYQDPKVCGYFRCTYISQLEPHGRGLKQGLVDFSQEAYPQLSQAYAKENLRITDYALQLK